jgi:hypothetical protein
VTPNPPATTWIAVIGVTIAASAFLGYLVTTFLFAFSGGQYRMVAIVNYGVLAMVAAPIVVAAVAWRIRSGQAAAKVTAAADAVGWACTVSIEWLLSFTLGAG